MNGRPSPDGKSVLVWRNDTLTLYPMDGGQPRKIKSPFPGGVRFFAQDARYVFTGLRAEVPLKVYRFDLETGAMQPWRELVPTDRTGVYNLGQLRLTPDTRWYVYSYVRDLSDLYIVEGLR